MYNTHFQSQAKFTNMSEPVFGDKIMTKTLSKSQIRSHNVCCLVKKNDKVSIPYQCFSVKSQI